MDAHGRKSKSISRNGANDCSPARSPDAEWIAFASQQGSLDIWRMRADRRAYQIRQAGNPFRADHLHLGGSANIPSETPLMENQEVIESKYHRHNRIVFGGVGPVPAEVTNNETWSYDYDTNSWAFLGPSGAPSVRAWHGMVYVEGDDDHDCADGDDGRRGDDEAEGRTILFGGAATRSGPGTNDTWTFDSATNAWTEVVDKPDDEDGDEVARQGG